ncbi:uncharacterized protein LOC132730779 [Ruditapes philippinarum]|uniref:uncharacterized protein LOC132730779 n=1 Tax=Ruditapes philippinarum TaxID=129788 RepID=UPI00295AD3D7|nr:uncharacterized protein LOC132730779 [Ruditapes philippinarum]
MAEGKHNNELDDRDSDTDDRGDDLDRSERFVETEKNPELFKSKSLNNKKPFYNGSILDNRMAEIRKSIYHIRLHWDEYETFMASLRQLLLENGTIDFKDETTRAHAERVLSSKRDWMTAETIQMTDVSFEAVKLYTSKEGHSRIYDMSNNIFRHEDSVVSVEMIRSVVFLVELINIDLFNYCLKCPERTNFEGIVYRGICVSDEDLSAFKALREEPISRRNIAVPLGLFSSSSSIKVSKKFIKHQLKQAKTRDAVVKPLIIKVHVIGLKPEYIQHYTKRFPSTVLTTICAVDIHKLSRHPSEKEVLLRGPFMLVLDMYEEKHTEFDQPCDVIEVVMLNANRDHISTSFLGDQDTLARDMFAAMVTVTRSEFAIEYCQNRT